MKRASVPILEQERQYQEVETLQWKRSSGIVPVILKGVPDTGQVSINNGNTIQTHSCTETTKCSTVTLKSLVVGNDE